MVIWLLSHQRSGSHFLRDTLASVNEKVSDLPPLLVSPGECLTMYPQDEPVSIDEDGSWNLWNFLIHYRKSSEKIFAKGSSESETVLARMRQGCLQLPLLVSELEDYFSRLAKLHSEHVFLGDVKINQLHLADGLYRSPSAPPAFLYHMIKNGKVIFLRRENLLEAYLSGLVASKSKTWHCYRTDTNEINSKLVDLSPFQVDPVEAFWGVKVLKEDILLTKQWLKTWGDNVLYVVYEHLFDPETGGINQPEFHRIATFCGLPTHSPWDSHMVRGTNDSHLVKVSNRSELQKHFRDQGAEQWFLPKLGQSTLWAA